MTDEPKTGEPKTGEPTRRDPRPRYGGGVVRMLIDTADGLVTTTGEIVELSEKGCALRTQRSIDARVVGRVSVQVAGNAVWLPIVTRAARSDSRGWTISCDFDRPTPEKQHAIRALLAQRLRLSA